ncbi:MAG: TylF/MycF/NovP-related O-methyltransferase [Candidatus Saccharimonadales bacterium]
MGHIRTHDNTVASLLSRYPLISNQVSKEQVRTILTELEKVITTGVEGGVVEFGCYIGTTSLFVRRLLDSHGQDREFHVYDSFAGLPPKSTWDASVTGEAFTAGQLSISKKAFLHEFQKAHLKPPVVHKGWFSDLTPVDVPKKIAFAFLDGDFYDSIRDSLRLVLPRMSRGGVLVIDDYAREALPGVARAVHEFLPANQGHTIHNLGVFTLPSA